VAPEELDREAAAEGQAHNMWPLEPESFDERRETVGVIRQAERFRGIERRRESGCIPRDNRELVRQRPELPTPGAQTVAHVPM